MKKKLKFYHNRDSVEIKDVASLSSKYNKSISQILLRWNYQKNNTLLASSCLSSHMAENLEIFDFFFLKRIWN